MRICFGSSLMTLCLGVSTVALAQSAPAGLDGRVGKLEKEMRAIQRTVFPQGVPVQPETGLPVSPPSIGNAATAPLADMTARVDALERQVATLTGQVETLQNDGRKISDRIKALEAQLAAAVPVAAGATAVESTPVATSPIISVPAPVAAVTASSSASAPKPAQSSTLASQASATTPARSDASRRAALAAVEVPMTGDIAEDAYSYGFRLYTAKLYPESQVKLKEFVAAYPRHKRASYAQNLLGRAYYDEGKPALASVAFYENYQKMPKGDRAPESLYWLGQALMKLNKSSDACKAYAEFSEVFGATASADLKTKVTKGRADAKCPA